MHRVATSCEARASHLIRAAQFNIGRAYYQGSGVRRSVSEAERLIQTFSNSLPSARQFCNASPTVMFCMTKTALQTVCFNVRNEFCYWTCVIHKLT